MYLNNATSAGAVLSVTATSTSIQSSSFIIISNSQNIYNMYSASGGLASMDNKYVSLTISSCTIWNVYGTTSGGMLYITNAATVTMRSTTIYDTFAPNGSIVYSKGISTNFVFASLTVTCNSTYNVTDAKALAKLQLYNTTSAFYIYYANTVTSSYNKFT